MEDLRDHDPIELIGMDDDNDTLPVCEAMDNREILPLSKDRDTLKTYIQNFTARGNTSIDVGMKWGVALLDPSLQTPVDNMIEAGMISDDFAARPHGYNDGETLKVIVLMTDGQNTSQYYIEDQFRRGYSNIWWNTQEEIYSVYVGRDDGDYDDDDVYDEPMFYWPHEDEWVDHAYGNGVFEQEEEETEYVCKSYKRNGSCKKYKAVTTVTVVEVDEPAKPLN